MANQVIIDIRAEVGKEIDKQISEALARHENDLMEKIVLLQNENECLKAELARLQETEKDREWERLEDAARNGDVFL